jgi:hypothetical protein
MQLVKETKAMATTNHVQMTEVRSSNIEAIGYDSRRLELFVRFKGDGARLYKYVKVPAMVWEHMLRASSKGTFVKKILIPYFQVSRITQNSVGNVSNGISDKVVSR